VSPERDTFCGGQERKGVLQWNTTIKRMTAVIRFYIARAIVIIQTRHQFDAARAGRQDSDLSSNFTP
jgi:hypothetical protein